MLSLKPSIIKVLMTCLCCGWFLMSCGGQDKGSTSEEADGEEASSKEDTTLTIEPVSSMVDPPKVEYNSYINDIALVVAGMPMEGHDSVLVALTKKDFYKDYVKFTEETFEVVKTKMLEPVREWCAEKGIQDNRKNTTCFYPFSGPDFMFAHTFYPRAHNYILLGLEKRGSTPDFAHMNDAEQKRYFEGLKHSMKYINSRGYFVTQHMGSDYSKTHLNGVTHMILYMMAHTDHKIVDVKDGWIDKEGKMNEIGEHAKSPDEAIRVKIIKFTTPDQTELKTLYFFNKNIEDTHIEPYPEVIKFIQSFPQRDSYLKAAQCAAFNPTFEVVRRLVAESDMVIQDDSGVPYHLLSDTAKFDTKLYGTYNSVIKDLSWCLQKDLMRDLEAKGDNTDLPFKISYNGNYNKGIIIYAKKK